MPQPPTRNTQVSLVLLLLFLLGSGFLTTSMLSYHASRESIRDSIVNTELPLTSDTVYSEIQKDLVRPILISSMMARDTFLRDWVLAGEQDAQQMTRYLREVQEHYGAFTSFFVSDKTLTYYQAKGVLKQVRADKPRDVWYYRVREMKEPYEINVDVDMANADRLTFFINYKVFDYDGNFIGATGVVLTVDAVVKLIDTYQRRIAALATTDSLTELPNRRGFDILCRWGGEEFILLLKDTDRHAAFELAEKLRQHCAQQRYAVAGEDLQISVSLGLSQWHPGETLHSLLSRADRALYRAKQGGRNRVCEATQDEAP